MTKILVTSVTLFSGVMIVSLMLAMFASSFMAIVVAAHWAIA